MELKILSWNINFIHNNWVNRLNNINKILENEIDSCDIIALQEETLPFSDALVNIHKFLENTNIKHFDCDFVKKSKQGGILVFGIVLQEVAYSRKFHNHILAALRAGEFAFKPAMSAAQVIAHLQTGKTVIRKVTIAEGLSNLEIADTLAKTPGLIGLLEPMPTEGHLLPETYHFSYGDSRAGLVKRMRQAMTRLLTEAWPNRGGDLPLKTAAEALVLASIVEKETGVASERRRVAGVFINRLRIGMRLQSDPTVIFGITKGRDPLGRSITRSDLRTETAYNTYVIKGLPPGPITNPGRAAILAVLNPADTKELYFVATGSGGHAFARNLREHNRNVAQWRKIERARKKAN